MYPMLAMRDTWFSQGATVERNLITEINIVDSYTPGGAVTAQWDGSSAKDGSITIYVEGTKLTIAGNGSGGIQAHSDSRRMFSSSAAGAKPTDDIFGNVTAITGLNLLDMSTATDLMGAFYRAHSLQSLDLSGWDVSNVKSFAGMFSASSNASLPPMALTEIKGLENWKTPALTDTFSLFLRCVNLIALDLSGWDMSKVTNAGVMFGNCTVLTTVGDLSGWDVGKVTNFATIFGQSPELVIPDISRWNMSSAKNLSHFMSDNGKVTYLDLSGWDVSRVENLNAAFNDCVNLEYINISGWNTANVLAFSQLFERCRKLKTIVGIEAINTSKAGTAIVKGALPFSEIFSGCSSLKKLNLSSMDTTHAYDLPENNNAMTELFLDMPALEEITLGPKFSRTGAGADPASVPPLPTPAIPGWDGKWYTRNRTGYAPADVPNNTAQTYYATKALADASPNLIESGTLNSIGDAIRAKDGTAAKINPRDMAAKIEAIPTGGGGGSCGNWSKVEVETWTPAENTKQYSLPKAVAEKLDLITISRPYAGAAEKEPRFLVIQDPVNIEYGTYIYADYGMCSSCEYTGFLNSLEIPSYSQDTFVGGQTYTVTKCYK